MAYRPLTSSLIIAHEGTTMSSAPSVAIPSECLLTDLWSDTGVFSRPVVMNQLHPGIKGMCKCAPLRPPVLTLELVHRGYLRGHGRTADLILQQVKDILRIGFVQYHDGVGDQRGPLKEIVNVGYSMGQCKVSLRFPWC